VLKETGIALSTDRPTSWSTFLKSHADAISEADFFTVDVWTKRGSGHALRAVRDPPCKRAPYTSLASHRTEAVALRFDDLSRAAGIVNADVLDAWFAPAAPVLTALCQHRLLPLSTPTAALPAAPSQPVR
jgi:hypothetical protein